MLFDLETGFETSDSISRGEISGRSAGSIGTADGVSALGAGIDGSACDGGTFMSTGLNGTSNLLFPFLEIRVGPAPTATNEMSKRNAANAVILTPAV